MSVEKTAAEIDRKLRNDFARRLKDYGREPEANDPALAVLFRSVAAHIEHLYAETDHIRAALLDELIAGLGMNHRAARPAQTVIRFAGARADSFIAAGSELDAKAPSGERIPFRTDGPLAVSAARLAFCALYQAGGLRVLTGLEISDELAAAAPSLEAVPVNLGPSPCLFLAIENLCESHLSHHGIHIETSPWAADLRETLLSEPWRLAGRDGVFSGEGILRPHRANAGVRQLRWMLTEPRSEPRSIQEKSIPTLPDGVYGPGTFLFPAVPPELRHTCSAPRGMETAFARLFNKPGSSLARPRAWLRIGLPAELKDIDRGITRILLHAITASNVEVSNQTVYFAADGTSIPVSREAGTGKLLVAPLSVVGESGIEYASDLTPDSSGSVGRYTIRNGRMLLKPGGNGERSDRYVNVRLWVTSGAAGNTVGLGQVQWIGRSVNDPELRVTNPAPSSGGSDGETYSDARARFAQVLLTRERLVTRADLVAAVRAFDRRLEAVDLRFQLRRTAHGLQRVHLVEAQVRRDRFVDFDEECRVLREELGQFLEAQSLFDVPVIVKLTEAAA